MTDPNPEQPGTPKLDERAARALRLKKIIAAGKNPYPAKMNRTHTIGDFLHQFETLTDTSATLAGRVRSLRGHGGSCFLTLEDMSGSVQLFFKKDVLSGYEELLDVLDVGDFLEVSGTPFTTKKGERSLLAQAARIISKTLAPLPEKWHGLTDVELRYRKRELDLLSNADVRDIFKKRSAIVWAIRDVLHNAGFLEVETPMLQPIPGGANARPFVTHHNALNEDFYLRIAPELYLKRLVVGGFDKVYEIGRCFRNEGIDPSHNPEFTMLEFYWAYAEKEQFITFLETIIAATIKATGNTTLTAPAWPRVSFRDAIKNACGIDIDELTGADDVVRATKAKKISVDFSRCVGFGEHLDELWKKTARAEMTEPTWVFDYPLELKPLARQHPTDPTKSATIQLVVGGAEIVNAYYHELNDPVDQRARFEAQQVLRDAGSEDAQSMDEAFLSSLEHGMPPTAGAGIGIDRLTALLTGAHSLKEVILFPTLRPTATETEANEE